MRVITNKKLKETIKNEDGAALVLAMMVLLVLSVLGASLGLVTVGSYRLGNNNRDSNSAYYIAEAGANMAYEEIKHSVEDAYENSNDSYNSYFGAIQSKIDYLNDKESYTFESQNGDVPTAIIEIVNLNSIEDENINEYIIKSTGEVADRARVVEKKFEVTWISSKPNNSIPLDLNSVLTFNKNPTINNPTTVIGNIKHPSSVKFKKNNEFTHDTDTWSVIVVPDEVFKWDEQGEALLSWISPLLKDIFASYNFENKMNSSETYNEKRTTNSDIIRNNGNITFNHGADFTGNIALNGGDIIVNAGAVIRGNIITNGGNITFNNGSAIEGNIISSGGDLIFNGDTNVNGSIITIGSNKKITVNNGATINGNLISNGGEIALNGDINVSGAILNPKGKLTVNNGGTFNGVVYVNDLSSNGVKTFIYSDEYINYFPFDDSHVNEVDAGNSENNIGGDLISSKPAVEN